MKTIREHLESIADTELREAALRNMVNADKYVEILIEALSGDFNWEDTTEGFAFWDEIWEQYYFGNTPLTHNLNT